MLPSASLEPNRLIVLPDFYEKSGRTYQQEVPHFSLILFKQVEFSIKGDNELLFLQTYARVTPLGLLNAEILMPWLSTSLRTTVKKTPSNS